MSKTLVRKNVALNLLYTKLEDADPGTPEFDSIAEAISKLEAKPKPGLSKDTIATLLTYAGLTILIVVVEIFGHSITSRALTAVPFRPRL